MVAATQSQPLPSPKQPPTPKPSPEEEALKRNTDCVYFLASPLTCKKGSECEYRHSEYARVNPRDCYYWLSGNCLNPKCGFRHPPLDGLIGTHVGAPASMPAANTVVPVPPILYNSGAPPSKQAVPCIFFQKGLCMKGDRCAFSHGLNPTFNKAPQPTVSASSFEPHTLKKDFGGLVKCSQPSKVATGVTLEAKTVPMGNGVSPNKNLPMSAGFDDDVPRYKMSIGPSAVNGSRPSRLHHLTDEQSFPTSKDTDEHLRESSPGFDVLVDDEDGDSDYYHGEDQYGRARGHEGRNRNKYDTGFGNIESMADADREIYHDSLGYDSFDRQRQYGWEQHRATAEKGRGSSHQERRSYSKSEGPGVTEEADLRYRLSQHRRVNGLRSVVSHDHAHENRGDEHNQRGPSMQDSHNLPQHGSTVSSRFRGRIKVPTSSAVDTPREMDRAQNWSSSGGPQFSSHQGRLRDRIKGRVDEDYSSKDGRSFRGPRMMDERHSDFAGPKRLAELKTGKNVDNKESQSLGKRKIMEENQQNEGDLSFKGPLPLSEILKRKRRAEAAASGNELSAGDNNDKEKTASKEEQMITANNSTGMVEGKSEVAQGEPSELPNASEHENGNNMMEEGIEEHELEGDDQGDGEYYYEEGEEGDYTYEEGENVEGDYNFEGGENVEGDGDYAYEEGEHVEGEEHLECER